jgi:transposase-like protein
MARRYPQARLAEIRAAYEKWEQTKYEEGSPTAAELAASLGISKPTLYDLKNRGWTYDNASGNRPTGDRARIARLEAAVEHLRRENENLFEALQELAEEVRRR